MNEYSVRLQAICIKTIPISQEDLNGCYCNLVKYHTARTKLFKQLIDELSTVENKESKVIEWESNVR